MRPRLRVVAAFLLAIGVLLSSGACSTRAGYDEVVLYYTSGTGDNRAFKECIDPGKAGSYAVDDEVFSIPTSLRTWNIRREGGDTDHPIESGTRPGADGQPGPHVVTYAAADFYINTDCKAGKDSPVVKFWESLGRRYGISEDGDDGFKADKFKTLLLNTIVPSQEKSLAEGTRFYSADDLDANTHGERGELERRMAPLFAAELRAKLGGDFFCGIGYDRGREVEWTEWVADGTEADGRPKVREEKRKGTCPPVRISITDIDYADAGIAQSRANVYKAEQDAKAKLIGAQAELDQSRILGQAASNESYLRYKQIQAQAAAAEACKANPNCTVIIDGTAGGGVNVNTK
jgi:hypothetical protein